MPVEDLLGRGRHLHPHGLVRPADHTEYSGKRRERYLAPCPPNTAQWLMSSIVPIPLVLA